MQGRSRLKGRMLAESPNYGSCRQHVSKRRGGVPGEGIGGQVSTWTKGSSQHRRKSCSAGE